MPAISGLNAAVAVNDADEVAIIQGGETKRLSADKLSGLKAIGEGQTWQELASSRVKGVTYTNTSGKPIIIAVRMVDSNADNVNIIVDGFLLSQAYWNMSFNGNVMINAIIPDGSTYSVNGNAALSTWMELR